MDTSKATRYVVPSCRPLGLFMGICAVLVAGGAWRHTLHASPHGKAPSTAATSAQANEAASLAPRTTHARDPREDLLAVATKRLHDGATPDTVGASDVPIHR